MDFEDILEKWDNSGKKNTRKPSVKKPTQAGNDMSSLLELYPFEEEFKKDLTEKKTPRQKRRNYRRMKPQEVLDLHGYNIVSAKVELDDFISRCRKKKIEKILIIHGKGLHSPEGEAVLRSAVKHELSVSPYIGEIGHPSEREGGVGATWAIIKY